MNRVTRYYAVGHRAQADELRGYWRKAYAWNGLCSQGQSDQQIAEQFSCSDDTVRNARRAHGLFVSFTQQGGAVFTRAKHLRRMVDKGLWETTARFYAKHGSLGDAMCDLYEHCELPSREFEAALQAKYGGPHHAERVLFARLASDVREAGQDVWALVDKGVLPKRVGVSFRAAEVAFGEQVQTVRDALHGQEGT